MTDRTLSDQGNADNRERDEGIWEEGHKAGYQMGKAQASLGQAALLAKLTLAGDVLAEMVRSWGKPHDSPVMRAVRAWEEARSVFDA